MKRWFNGLQSLRGILFLLVFYSHSGKFFYVPNYLDLGAFSVCVFFILSGFLSSYDVYSSDWSFIRIISDGFSNVFKKLKKFYPIYFLFLLVAIPLTFKSFKNLFYCTFLIQSYFFDTKIALSFNWPTWFLSSLLISYFLAPLLCRVFRFKMVYENIICVLFTIVIIAIWTYVWRNDSEIYGRGYYYVYIFPLARALDFIIGINLGFLFQKNDNLDEISEFKVSFATVVETVVIISICGLFTIGKIFVPRIATYTAVFIPFAVMLILVFARERGLITRYFANNKVILFIGKLSFELYIVHRMVLLFYSHFDQSMFSWFSALLSTLLLGIMFYSLNNLIIIRKQQFQK